MRGREPAYRVAGVPARGTRDRDASHESELQFLADAGRLQDIPGVGDKTAAVIAEALRRARRRSTSQKLLEHVEDPGTEAGEALRAQLKGDLHVHSDWSDGGDTIRAMAEQGARRSGTTTSRSPTIRRASRSRTACRPTACASSSTSSPSSTRSSRRSASSPASRSTSSKTARSTSPRSCSRASTSSSRACTRSCAWNRPPMTRRMVGGDREPARRRARSLHRPVAHRTGPTAVGVRRRRRDRGVPRVRHRAGGQLPARAARPAERRSCARRSRRASSLRSAPTRTRPSSSSGSPTAPTAPPSAASTPTVW